MTRKNRKSEWENGPSATAPASSSPTPQTTSHNLASSHSNLGNSARVRAEIVAEPERHDHGEPNKNAIPQRLKSNIEALSGISMNSVKVHYNSTEPASMDALGYAQGDNIHLAPGQEQHLPHELWHVVQQSQGRASASGASINGDLINTDPGLEREAATMGERAQSEELQAGRPLISLNVRPSVPMQFVRLNMRPDGTITGISDYPSRPPSNMNHQGQHLTAYVVFEDMVLNRVRGRNLAEATDELMLVLDEMGELPAVQTGSQPANRILDFIGILKNTLLSATTKEEVCDVIADILRLRNMVPGTAESGTGGGHGEAGNSGILNQAEAYIRTGRWPPYVDHNSAAEQCLYAVWRLLDYDPPNPATPIDAERIARVIATHFRSIISAYPHVEAWLTARGVLFSRFLKAHRGDIGMPLVRVAPAELNGIFDRVIVLLQ